MANPLPNEKELFQQIKKENIRIIPEIWDLLYHRIGDDVTTINLLCHNYLDSGQSIPIIEAKKILLYTRHIKEMVNEITVSSKEKLPFPEFQDNIPLHPIIREMLTHYIGNDIYMINFMVQDTIDPAEPHPVSPEITRKILSHTRSIREFMERLRIVTYQEEKPAGLKETRRNNQRLSKEEILLRIRKCLAEEFNLSNEEKIQPASRFREDLGLDSVDAIRAVMALEQEFGFEIPDDAADGVISVSQAVDYIYQRSKERHNL